MTRRPTPADIEALVPLSVIKGYRAVPTAVYRAYDEPGRLLYVGITYRLAKRMRGHAASSVWWPEMASMELDWHGTAWHARMAELIAIHTEQPLHNQEGAKPQRFIRKSHRQLLEGIRTSANPTAELLEAIAEQARWAPNAPLDYLVVGAFDGSLNVDLPSLQDRL